MGTQVGEKPEQRFRVKLHSGLQLKDEVSKEEICPLDYVNDTTSILVTVISCGLQKNSPLGTLAP